MGLIAEDHLTSEMLQELDFSKSSLCKNFLGEHVCYFLDSDAFTSLSVGSSTGEM